MVQVLDILYGNAVMVWGLMITYYLLKYCLVQLIKE
jgi:hypothetical protein